MSKRIIFTPIALIFFFRFLIGILGGDQEYDKERLMEIINTPNTQIDLSMLYPIQSPSGGNPGESLVISNIVDDLNLGHSYHGGDALRQLLFHILRKDLYGSRYSLSLSRMLEYNGYTFEIVLSGEQDEEYTDPSIDMMVDVLNMNTYYCDGYRENGLVDLRKLIEDCLQDKSIRTILESRKFIEFVLKLRQDFLYLAGELGIRKSDLLPPNVR